MRDPAPASPPHGILLLLWGETGVTRQSARGGTGEGGDHGVASAEVWVLRGCGLVHDTRLAC